MIHQYVLYLHNLVLIFGATHLRSLELALFILHFNSATPAAINIVINIYIYRIYKNKYCFRTHHLRCKGQVCDQVTILHIEFLDFTHYILKVFFYGLETFHQHYTIKEVTFYVSGKCKFHVTLWDYHLIKREKKDYSQFQS